MGNKKMLVGIAAAAGMLALILDGEAAFTAAGEGVDLCLRIIIPSIFPFLLLSIFMNQSLMGNKIPLLHSAAKLMGIPEGAESILISSFLGGYPAGAQAVAQHYESGAISKNSAEKLIAFTNNAGPAFIFGMVSHAFSERRVTFALWVIHIFSAVCVSQLMNIPKGAVRIPSSPSKSSAMENALKITATVCGWVILFRIIICFITRIFFRNSSSVLAILLTGILELSNGCLSLEYIGDLRLRFIICCAMLSFGGLCVTMQTISVIGDLNMKYYILGKLLQIIISMAAGFLFIYEKWICFPILAGLVLFLRKRKNYCRKNILLRV